MMSVSRWLAPYISYTVTKYGMTLMSMGLAEEFREKGIAVNTLWPRTTIATAAVEFEVGAEFMKRSRTPAIVADAACMILAAPAQEMTGQTLLDEEVLKRHGRSDFDQYRNNVDCEDPDSEGLDNGDLALDLFVDA